MKPLRKRKCKSCREWYQPRSPYQKWCVDACRERLMKKAIEKTNIQKARALKRRMKRKARAERENRRKAKPLSHWIKLTQTAFNQWIRLRDKDQPCISCGTWESPIWDAGHYMPTSTHSQLRFHPDNCFRQCRTCNHYKSGNRAEYRKALVYKIGEEKVIALETNQEIRKYRREELKEMRLDFNRRAKEMEK